MPELPEVEVLVRHLRLLLPNRTIRAVRVHRPKVVVPTSIRLFVQTLRGAKFCSVARRGKYLLFSLRGAKGAGPVRLVGHLGMTGRMYLLPARAPLPRHAAVVLDLGRERFVYEDARYFGRLTLDGSAVAKLGPEPLGAEFTVDRFTEALRRSGQAIKVKLLDQKLVAGVGNIYAGEALFRAAIAPTQPARSLSGAQIKRLWRAIRQTLRYSIAYGSTVPRSYAGNGARDGLFYFGRAPGVPEFYEERLLVYDRAGQPCVKCGAAIRRSVQAARSTYYCPRCQRG